MDDAAKDELLKGQFAQFVEPVEAENVFCGQGAQVNDENDPVCK